jgi:hypothetical protein
MNRRNKLIVSIVLILGLVVIIGGSLGLYLMNQYPLLSDAFDDNPFAVLEVASRIAVSQILTTPTKQFDIEELDKEYNQTVEFSENRLELETAEQIIEWSVIHQNQPWVENITEFLVAYDVPVSDITLHLGFIETESAENPVMTITYFFSNNTQIVEKGWIDRGTHPSYTCLMTEMFAVDNLQNFGDSKKLVTIIITNYDGAISLRSEHGNFTNLE